MWLTLILAARIVYSYECPTDVFTPCATGGGTAGCTIPGDVTRGFVSYGSGDYFLLIPFSNDGGKKMTVGCNDHLGDPDVHNTKDCCYVATDNGFDSSGFTKMADQSGTRKDVTGPLTIRYGDSGQYLYHSFFEKAFIGCTIDLLGDPRQGLEEYCESKNSVPKMLSDASFLTCSGQGTTASCHGMSAFSVHWVRCEGLNNNRALWSLALSKSGSFPCEDRSFHDPDPGSSKFCSVSGPLVQFENLVGEWVVGQICGGGCEHGFSIKVGFTKVDSKTVTDEWTKTFQSSVSLGFAFKKAEGSVDMGGSVSHTVSNQLSTSLQVEAEVKSDYHCSQNTIWRWRIAATQSHLYDRLALELLSDIYWCGDDSTPPQCPPGFCESDDCTACTDMSDKAEL